MTTHAKIEALIATGSLELALDTARAELDRLEDDVPHAQSLILRTIAAALLEAGRAEEAFTALRASADLDRATSEQPTAPPLDLPPAAIQPRAGPPAAQASTASPSSSTFSSLPAIAFSPRPATRWSPPGPSRLRGPRTRPSGLRSGTCSPRLRSASGGRRRPSTRRPA